MSGPRWWQLIANEDIGSSIAANGGQLYRIGYEGRIYRYLGSPYDWELLDTEPATAAIAPDSNRELYQRHSGGDIYRYLGSPHNWRQIDANAATAAIAANGGQLYQRHRTGDIYRYLGSPYRWDRIDGNAATVKITSDSNGELYQRHSGGDIYHYLGSPYQWDRIDGNAATIDIVANGGQLYQLHNTWHIYRYLGSPYRWELVDTTGDTRRIFVGSSGRLYKLDRNLTPFYYYWSAGAWYWYPLDNVIENVGIRYLASTAGELYQQRGGPAKAVLRYTGPNFGEV